MRFLYVFRVHFNHTLIGFSLPSRCAVACCHRVALVPAEQAERGVAFASHKYLEEDLELIDELTFTPCGTDTLFNFFS